MIDQMEIPRPEPVLIPSKELYEERLIPAVKKYFEQQDITDRASQELFTKALPKMLWDENLTTFAIEITDKGQTYRLEPGIEKYTKEGKGRVKELLNEDDIPIVKVPDLEDFIKAINEYAETAKNINYLVYLSGDFFNYLFVNMTDEDLEDPVPFIRRSTEIFKGNHLNELNEAHATEKITTLETRMWVQQKPTDPEYESPVHLEIVLSEEEPDGTPPGTLPVVRFAIVDGPEKMGYIYSTQDMTRDRGIDWADKKMLDREVANFESSAKELRDIVSGLSDKYPELMENLFGPVPKKVLALRSNPRNFVLALNEFLSQTKPELGKKYLDTKALEQLGITPQIKEELGINGNAIMFAGYCKSRDESLQYSLGRRKFRKNIDRKLLTITKDSRELETEEAKEYLKKMEEAKGLFEKKRAEFQKEYEESITEKILATQETPAFYKDQQRLKMVDRIDELTKEYEATKNQIDHVENISEVTPAAMVSILTALTEMQKRGIQKVMVPVNMPLRWQNHIQTGRRYGWDEEKYVQIHHNITEKFVRTFRALAAHVPGIEIVSLPESPEIPLELKLDPAKWNTEQPILQDVIRVLSKPLMTAVDLQNQAKTVDDYWEQDRESQLEEYLSGES